MMSKRKNRGVEPRFWKMRQLSSLPVRDQAVGGIIGGNAYGHSVAHEHANFEFLHAAGKAGRHDLPAIELNRIRATGRVDDLSFCADEVFSRH